MTEKIEAGSLTSDHVGATVSVTWVNGKITSTVTDVLMSFTNVGSFVTLHFKSTKWQQGVFLGAPTDDGLRVGFRTTVTIGEKEADQ